jgi:hypothetical protein
VPVLRSKSLFKFYKGLKAATLVDISELDKSRTKLLLIPAGKTYNGRFDKDL